MIVVLITQSDIALDRALQYAIMTDNPIVVELILDGLEEYGQGRKGRYGSSRGDFTDDEAPMILAAQMNNEEIIKLLISTGYNIERPHPPSCFCTQVCRYGLGFDYIYSAMQYLEVAYHHHYVS